MFVPCPLQKTEKRSTYFPHLVGFLPHEYVYWSGFVLGGLSCRSGREAGSYVRALQMRVQYNIEQKISRHVLFPSRIDHMIASSYPWKILKMMTCIHECGWHWNSMLIAIIVVWERLSWRARQ
jgi:hypothetical protein